MLLESYWKTDVDRAIDSMCMKVDQHVIRGLDEKVLGPKSPTTLTFIVKGCLATPVWALH